MDIKYDIIVGKLLSMFLLLMLPFYVYIFGDNESIFYERLFAFNSGIFFLRMGQEYYLFNGEDQTDYLAARRSLKFILLILFVLFFKEHLVLYLLISLGGELSYVVIRNRIICRSSLWPYLFEGILSLLMVMISYLTYLSYILSIISIILIFSGPLSSNFRSLLSGFGTMSNTIVSLLVSNILPLFLLLDVESFYVYSRAAGIVGMSSTYGNLLYQKVDNNRSLKSICKISLYQLPVFLGFGVTYVVINNLEFIWTFFISAIVNVLTGPVQIALLRMKKANKILQASIASILLFGIILLIRPTAMLFIGLSFSSVVLLENILSYIFYERAKSSRS